MPTAKSVPTPIKAQGLASYKLCGVHARISLVYSQRRVPQHFVTMMEYAFFANIHRLQAIPRVVSGALDDGHRTPVGFRPDAHTHLLRRLLPARALRGGQSAAHVCKHLRGPASWLGGLLDRAPG